MPMIDLDGLRLHYQQKGAGEDVVLVHAVTSNMSVWLFSGLMDVLAREFRVTAYDMRGHGASAVPPAGYTSADMAEDFGRLHEALNLGPAILIGHSFGAVVSTHAAVVYPRLVRGLILSDPFFPGLAHLEPNLAEMEGWREVRLALAEAGVLLPHAVDLTGLFAAVGALTPAQREGMGRSLDDASLRWLSALPRLARTTCGRDVFDAAGLTPERLCGLSQPMVALYDEHTAFAATRRFLEDNLPNVTVETVPGARHLAPLQSTEAFAGLVQKHCRALGGSRLPPPETITSPEPLASFH